MRGIHRRLPPDRFAQNAQPDRIILLFRYDSLIERRKYTPYRVSFQERLFASNAFIRLFRNRLRYSLEFLTSEMHGHSSLMPLVGARIESVHSLFQFTLVYNNYPWPHEPDPYAQVAKVEELAEAVLLAERARYPDSTLAQLYDPLTMPPNSSRPTSRLDREVERCYRPEPFTSDRERVEYLFGLYEQLAAPLLPTIPPTRRHQAQRPHDPGNRPGI